MAPRKGIKEPLTEEEFNRVLESCDGESERRLVLVLRYTGAHISNFIKFDGSNLKEDDEFIQWDRVKTGMTVKIPTHKALKPFIRAFLENKRPKTRQYYNDILNAIGRRAGVVISPLRFRHTFAVDLLNKGFKVNEVMEAMGVTNPKTIMRYLRLYQIDREKWKEAGY